VEYSRNATFRENYESFAELCRQSINPDLQDDAIRNMLVQHLLTERIFRKVFDNQEFLKRNVIAVEIEKVISSITVKHFSRDSFLKSLDHFYKSIERAAEAQTEYTEKQHFLNAVYEKFFQNFDEKQADTMGIVYTPQPIVDFMVRSVEEILQAEFGKSLSDSGVHILDPFTGTGNFITRIMQQIKRSALPHKYANELHCNEIMLLPYYIASMNIEHAYLEKVGQYAPFEGICLVDSFELAEASQHALFTTENTARVRKQKAQEITVVVANPPYNAKQDDERDESKNRSYPELNARIKETYSHDSTARLHSKLGDPYVRAFRWASDRIGNHGVIAYISNSSFIRQCAFDGMRKHLGEDFSRLYIIDLGGNVREYPQLSGTTHNVFGIQVGVCISLLIKHSEHKGPAQILFTELPLLAKRGEKQAQLEAWSTISKVPFNKITPNRHHTWLNQGSDDKWYSYLPLTLKLSSNKANPKYLFHMMGPGLKTNRDRYVFNFQPHLVESTIHKAILKYEHARHKYLSTAPRPKVEAVIDNDDQEIKWSRQTKKMLVSGESIEFHPEEMRVASYRPFTLMPVYFHSDWNDERGKVPSFFPSRETENVVVTVSGIGMSRPFQILATNTIAEHQHAANGQSFGRYYYDDHGVEQDNITDWGLKQFRDHFQKTAITKSDVFAVIYAMLHHPEYRKRYSSYLVCDLPRIPFPPDFHVFAKAGKRLMELHIDYEKQPEYKLEHIESETADVSYRVERMKLNSKDESELRYNDFLTLRGIPLAAFDYKLGNRSALEWVIDQYRVSTDPRSGIVNDPNREDDDKYILRLIGQVITVSLETQKIIASLPSLNLDE
jgi:predicted helicase